MIRRISFSVFAIMCVMIGLYPFVYFIIDREFGLLGGKDQAILEDLIWNLFFYPHIVLGGIALLIGWIQFNKVFRTKFPERHRVIGKVYVFTVLVSATAGIYIGFFAEGGPIAKAGFLSLGIFWFISTFLALIAIRKENIGLHRKMMIYSYSACFAAVTLRIYIGFLPSMMGGFIPAYRLIAWICWVPNLFVAYIIIRNLQIASPQLHR